MAVVLGAGVPFEYRYCFCGLASRKSFTIGTIIDIRSIRVTCVVIVVILDDAIERHNMQLSLSLS